MFDDDMKQQAETARNQQERHSVERARLRDLLANTPIRFWTCPIDEHGQRRNEAGWPVVTVEWIDDVAHCTQPGCGLTSANVRIAFCENYLELEDRPCDGFLRFKPGDLDAACYKCGGRCGRLVANYVTRPGQDLRS